MGEGRHLGLVYRDMAVMRLAIKMSCAVTMPWGWLCAFALRRRFLLAFLLSVCTASSGVFVGLFLVWLVVGISVFAIFMMSGLLANFLFVEE